MSFFKSESEFAEFLARRDGKQGPRKARKKSPPRRYEAQVALESIRLEIAPVPPNVNRLLGLHFGVVKKLRDPVKAAVAFAVRDACRGLKFEGRVVTDIHFVGPKPMDEDNLANSAKWVIDGLVGAGCILDDSPKWRKMGRLTQERGSPGRLVVRIRLARE